MATSTEEVITESSPLLTRRAAPPSTPPHTPPSTPPPARPHGPVPSLPNFRNLPGTRLYRSSCPERMRAEDVTRFVQLDIRSIIDLRHLHEVVPLSPELRFALRRTVSETAGKTDSLYDALFLRYRVAGLRESSESCQLLDRYYRSVRVNSNKRSRDMVFVDLAHSPGDAVIESEPPRTHYHCRLHTSEYSWAVVNKATCCQKVLLGLLFGVDTCCHTGHASRAAGRLVNEEGLAGQYRDTVAVCGRSIRTALLLLSRPENCPAVVCCSYGKDRTGVIVALTLSVLGKSRDFIVEDYARSMPEMSRVSACMERNLDRYDLDHSFGTAPPANMESMLDFIADRYGSVDAYLDSIGFTSEDRRRMRETLLLDTPEIDVTVT